MYGMTATTIGLLVGCICGGIVLAAVVLLLIRWYRNKKIQSSKYEQINETKRIISTESGLTGTPVSMRQIPFTVPSHGGTPTSSRRSETRSEAEFSTGTESEPSSPTGKRPSVEIPGAYALGTIDPSLYKISDEDDDYDQPDDHIGRVWFAVEYERESEKLLVTLIKAKNLPSKVSGSVTGCDPFVRIYLVPDERRYLQSKFRKKSCNPKFEETYVFQVSHKSIQDRVLKLSVFDVDRHKRHIVIGHAMYALKDHECESNERVVVWRDLEKEISESSSDKGEILISMCYNNHMERLTVGVFEGKSFKSPDGTSPGFSSIDSYIKVSLLIQNKVLKTKRTDLIKKTPNPNFNESFTFKLPVNTLDTASVSISAMQYVSGHKDKLIGRINLGSFMFARGKELDHWNEMVANQREQVSQCHVFM